MNQPRDGGESQHSRLRQLGQYGRSCGSLDGRAAADACASKKIEFDAVDVFLRQSNRCRLAVKSALVFGHGEECVAPRHEARDTKLALVVRATGCKPSRQP